MVTRLLTITFCLYMRLATIVKTRVTAAGKPSGIKHTTMPMELTTLPRSELRTLQVAIARASLTIDTDVSVMYGVEPGSPRDPQENHACECGDDDEQNETIDFTMESGHFGTAGASGHSTDLAKYGGISDVDDYSFA